MELAEDGDLHARLKKQRGRPLKEEMILNCEHNCYAVVLLATVTASAAAVVRRPLSLLAPILADLQGSCRSVSP